MTREDKDLLIKDLCARLPYRTKLDTLDGSQELSTKWLAINMCNIASPYLPYLIPLSSMTEEQRIEYSYLHSIIFSCFEDGLCEAIAKLHEWLNKNHFDYRGLIEKGLAIEAPKGMYN